MGQKVLFTDIEQLMSLKGALKNRARQTQEKDLALINKAAMAVNNGVIEWVGKQSKLPPQFKKWKKKSLKGLNVFPGFIDCHTHMIFAGDRKNEFELRNQGVSYQEIAKQGGGILSTVEQTRKAKLEELIRLGQERVKQYISQGVTTIEVKSGYGLNLKTESKILKAAKKLKKANIVTTYLGAHAIPKDVGDEKKYLEQLIKDLDVIKKEKLAKRVDIFIEKGYFSIEEGRKYLKIAQEKGFDLCIHADQMSAMKASALAVELGAKSADHAICLSDSEKKQMAESETTAVLLPCADFYLQCDYPDARKIIDNGGRVALATDFNPGSSPTQSLALLGVLSRLEMKMTLAEVFVAMTLGGAFALSLENNQGALVEGYEANFFTSKKSWSEFFYDMSPLPVEETFLKAVRTH